MVYSTRTLLLVEAGVIAASKVLPPLVMLVNEVPVKSTDVENVA